jgi:hypothetical protein
LQRHLAQTHKGHDERKQLYILDESSLASTRQMIPALKEVVEKLSRGQVIEAMEKLDAGGRVHEIAP